jgi:hypothetical protein
LSALRTSRLYLLPLGNIPGTHFCYRLSQPQGHSAAGRIMSMTNSSDAIGNRTRDLQTCSAVPQTTTPPRTPPPPSMNGTKNINMILESVFLIFCLGHVTGQGRSPNVLSTGIEFSPGISHILYSNLNKILYRIFPSNATEQLRISYISERRKTCCMCGVYLNVPTYCAH